MSHAFARKLSLTAVLLGCGTRKELCARFRTVNPQTEVDLERSFKWLQGRALPRSPTVYEDWARLIGTHRGGTWISACSEEAFLDELCLLYGANRNDLLARAQRFLGEGGGAITTSDALLGQFVAYSWAWSPFHTGELIRGRLSFAEAARARLDVTYTEDIPGGRIELSGQASRNGRVIHANLVARGDERIDLLLLAPGRPADILVGLLQGQTVATAELQLASSRIVLFRTLSDMQGAGTEGSCYIPFDPTALTADLERQGIGVPLPGLADLALSFLARPASAGALHADAADLARFLTLTVAQG